MKEKALDLYRFGDGGAAPAEGAQAADAEAAAPAPEKPKPSGEGVSETEAKPQSGSEIAEVDPAEPIEEAQSAASADEEEITQEGGDAEDPRARAAMRRMEYLARSCEETQRIYPRFDLGRELVKPRFIRLVDSGASVREAYEIVNRDELMGQAIAEISERIREDAYRAISSRRSRPEENGSSPAAVTKRDPARMTKQQRDEYSRRAMRGERVTF